MLIVLKSGPETVDGQRGLALAQDTRADLVLLQNAVLFAQQGRLGLDVGEIVVLDEDAQLRGCRPEDFEERTKLVGYAELVDLLATAEKVVGVF